MLLFSDFPVYLPLSTSGVPFWPPFPLHLPSHCTCAGLFRETGRHGDKQLRGGQFSIPHSLPLLDLQRGWWGGESDLPKVTARIRKSRCPDSPIRAPPTTRHTFALIARTQELSLLHIPSSSTPTPRSPESLLTLRSLRGPALPAGAPFRRIPTPTRPPLARSQQERCLAG